MKILFVSLLALYFAFSANSQTQPKFEVSSVKRTDQCGLGRNFGPASVTLNGMPLKPILMEAFHVAADRIVGPSWLETECYDISAKFPEGATQAQLPVMLQALFAERFKLAAHKEDRQSSGYVLVVDKGGPKCKEDDPKTEFMGAGRAGQMFVGRAGHGALKAVMTMSALASNLSRQGYGPVQDLTGLTGKYDIALTWTPSPDFEPKGASADVPAAPEPEGSLFAALREQLGLKLEHRQISVQFLVIDHIDRIPTEN